jgi:hypothetical protein
MNTSLTDFRSRCLEATLDLLWRQWCSLGVAGHARPVAGNRLIDVEALLLTTTSVGRYEPRLFDEALDWLAAYGSLVNLQRLNNLQRTHAVGDDRVLRAIAAWLAARATQPRWKTIAKPSASDKKVPPPEPLFLDIKGSAVAKADPIFLAQGLKRGVFEPRGMSRAPHPTQPPNLMVSLRALIGVSVRVEIVLHLAGSPAAAHAAEIARATGYAPRTVQAVLQEMLLSGHLLGQEPPVQREAKVRRGSNRRYHIQPANWKFLTAGKPLPQWTPWAALFAVARSVITAIPGPDDKVRHPAVISSQLRETLAAQGQSLAASGLLPHLDLRVEASGAELLETLSERLPKLLASL